MPVQARGPLPIRAGFGRHLDRLTGLQLAVERLQVVQQHTPRNAVHHQVMDRQQQALAAIVHVHQQGPQQRPVFQVEAALGVVAQGVELFHRRRLPLPQQAGRRRLGIGLLPLPVHLGKAQAQAVMVFNQTGQGRCQCHDVETLARHQQQRLVPVLPLGNVALEEPMLHRRQRHRAARQALIDRMTVTLARYPCQAAQGLVLKQRFGIEHDPGLPRTADHLHGDDGVAAQLEEVVFQANAVEVQHVLPDRREGFFQWTVGRDEFALLLAAVNGRQRLAVEFAVGVSGSCARNTR